MVSWQEDGPATNVVETLVKTLITYDNGDNWDTLIPPSYDSHGVPINCDGCSLNLFGQTTWLGIGGK